MSKKHIIIALFFLIGYSLFSQDLNDFPVHSDFMVVNEDSSSFHGFKDFTIDLVVVGESLGRGFYQSGNLRSEGGLIKGKTRKYTVSYSYKDTTEVKYETVYIRDGYWKVYYDSKDLILRSEGAFENGEKDGAWTIYKKNGKPKYELVYYKGQVLKKYRIDGQSGVKILMFEISKLNVFVLNNEGLMILLILAFMGIRVLWNRIIYNMVNGYHYYPISKNFLDAYGVTVYTMLIFWWFIKPEDSSKVVKYKRIGNWFCVISLVLIIIGTILFAITPGAYN